MLHSYSDASDDLEKIATHVVDCCIQVHKNLGPGYPERVYESALGHEFFRRGIVFEKQKTIQVIYPPDIVLDPEYRLDMVVENEVILELKCVEKIMPVHEAQLLSYMRMAKMHMGFLLNFNVPLMKDGIKRLYRK